jgi:hypothetical protein
MEPVVNTELVAILVGTIFPNSYPLCLNLYIERDGRGHVSIIEQRHTMSVQQVVQDQIRAFDSCVRGMYRNEYSPPWFFISLYPGATPRMLYRWSTPWACIALWRKWIPGPR